MKCSICGKKISGHGHNPFPVTMAGNCCDRCNEKIVMPVRVFMATLKNKNYAMLILEDEVKLVKPENKYFTLKEKQKLVGGYITVVPSSFPGYYDVVDEEGDLKKLYFNKTSYLMSGTDYVGNVIICPVRLFEK